MGVIRYISLLLFIGLAWGQSKMDINNLIDRGGLMYATNDDKPYTGSVFDFSENGQKKLNGRYRNGLKNGKWTWWNMDGGTDSTGSLRKGLLHGQWKFYHDNGQLKAMGFYRNGDGTNRDDYDLTAHGRHGKWTFWHENGLQATEITYKDGERVGIWISWNEQGEKVWEGTLEEYNAAVKAAEEALKTFIAEEARLAEVARLVEEARLAAAARFAEDHPEEWGMYMAIYGSDYVPKDINEVRDSLQIYLTAKYTHYAIRDHKKYGGDTTYSGWGVFFPIAWKTTPKP